MWLTTPGMVSGIGAHSPPNRRSSKPPIQIHERSPVKKRFWLFVFLVSTIAGGLVVSWLTLGCWWKSGEPCSLSPAPFSRTTIEPPWLLPFGTKVLANEGSVHISPIQQDIPSHELIVEIAAPGCNDTPCTQVFERTGSLSVNLDDQSIQLTSRFAIRPFEFGPNACSPVIPMCGGAGLVEFRTGELPDGIYQVWLGLNKIGEIAIPLDKPQQTLYSPFPSSAALESTNSLYPPPFSTPVIAYPAPVDTLPSPAAPYPEPLLASPAASSSPTPAPTKAIPQPVWYSPVITIPLSSSKVGAILAGKWVSPTRLSVETLGIKAGGSFWVDLDANSPTVSRQMGTFTSGMSYSATSKYAVLCGNPMQLVEAATHELISQADLVLAPGNNAACEYYVSWAGDETAAFTARDAGGELSVFLWQVDGSLPLRIGQAADMNQAFAWSPDFKKLIYITLLNGQWDQEQAVIVDRQGKEQNRFPVNFAPEGAHLAWFTHTVIAFQGYNTTWRYYNTTTGQLLFSWQNFKAASGGPRFQPPNLSPDQRFVALESGGNDPNGDYHKTYRMFDLESSAQTVLLDLPDHFLAFNAWSLDSRIFYILHLPRSAGTLPDPGLPFGLLAYDVHNREFSLLAENAQQAIWDENMERTFISYRVDLDQPAGKQSLRAGIYDPQQQNLIGMSELAEDVFYFDPGAFPVIYQNPYRCLQVAWSPDGSQVAFTTLKGDLVMMSLDGQSTILAANVDPSCAFSGRVLAWSPDGSRLFVSDGGSAWVVSVPKA